MHNYTQDLMEIKREITLFSEKLSDLLTLPKSKFVLDMIYGINRTKCTNLTLLAESLMEKETKHINTIDRLSTNLNTFNENDRKVVQNNLLKEVNKYMPEELIFLFDDSDQTKPYSRKLEDLDIVIDGSSKEKNKKEKGYYVAECVALTKNTKQPISIYSQIYSTKTKGFKSKNVFTHESIDTAINFANGRKATLVFDRGYDDGKLIDKVDDRTLDSDGKLTEGNNRLIVRIKDNRNFLFKGKKKNIGEIAKSRKGKIRMTLLFDNNEEHQVYLSHTRAILQHNNREYTIVIVYGLSEDRPLILLTNQQVKSKDDVINIVRHYFYRWRIEEHFRVKKVEFGLEKMRVQTLASMNNIICSSI